MSEDKPFMQQEAILGLIAGMARVLRNRLRDLAIEQPAMIGIHTGGAWIAGHLHRQLGIRDPLGTLDISFYRDDFTRVGMNPQVRPSHIPFDVDDRHIVLVDDVLQTGRTIRAALNEIFDYGRPASVQLVVLVERSGCELPIQACVSGLKPPLQPDEYIRLSGPDPLSLEIGRARRRRPSTETPGDE